MAVITLKASGKKYELGFDRASVSRMADNGFDLNKMESDPTSPYRLFAGAFIMNHSDTTDEEIESLWKGIANKTGLSAELGKLYAAPIKELYDEPTDDAKKVSWEVVK